MRFELTKDFLGLIRVKIAERDELWLAENVLELHYADIAEILDEINIEEARFIYLHLNKDQAADVLIELEEDVRERFLSHISSFKDVSPVSTL